MNENKTVKQARKKIESPKPQKSQRLVSFEEFFLGKNVRNETKAAIKMKLDGDLFHTNEEWNEILDNYLN